MPAETVGIVEDEHYTGSTTDEAAGVAGDPTPDLTNVVSGNVADNASWGADGFDGLTQIVVSGVTGGSTVALTGTSTTVYWNQSGEFTGTDDTDAAANMVITNGTGAYVFTQTGNFLISNSGDPTEQTDSLGTVTFTGKDGDGDTATIALALSVKDDMPVAYDPTDALLHNTVSATETESLNSIPAIGADSYSTGYTNVIFNSAQEGDSGLTSNDDAIILHVSVDGKTLTGSTTTNTIFTVEIDDVNDEYTVNMVGTIDNNSGASFSDLSGTGEAGNSSFKIVESSTTDNLEILFTPFGTASSVNSDSDDVGVDSQWIDNGDGLRVDFGKFSNDDSGTSNKGDDTFAIDGKTNINGFRFSIDALNGVTPTIILSAYDDGLTTTELLDPITKVEIYNDSGVSVDVWEVGYGYIGMFTDAGGGTVGVTGLLAGYSVVTYTADGYDGIKIMNESGGKFSLSNMKVEVTNIGDPVDQSFDTILTDADGDTSEGTIDVTFAPSDAILGNSNTNILPGTGEDDMIFGGDGDDTIDGGAGADAIYGGAGNDTIVFDAADSHIDGGTGIDTLLVAETTGALDFSKVDNVEKIDLNAAGPQAVTLSLDDVLDMTDSSNVLEITGGTGDEVTLTGVVELSSAVAGDWTHNGGGLFTQFGTGFQVTINSPNNPIDGFTIITDNGDDIDI